MTFCEMYKQSKGGCYGCPNRYVCDDSPLKVNIIEGGLVCSPAMEVQLKLLKKVENLLDLAWLGAYGLDRKVEGGNPYYELRMAINGAQVAAIKLRKVIGGKENG